MPRFYASVNPRAPGEPPPTLIIEAESAFDAKAWAEQALGKDGLHFLMIGQPDVVLRWVGDDFNKGGTPGGRHMEVCERIGTTNEMTPWRRP